MEHFFQNCKIEIASGKALKAIKKTYDILSLVKSEHVLNDLISVKVKNGVLYPTIKEHVVLNGNLMSALILAWSNYHEGKICFRKPSHDLLDYGLILNPINN